MKHLKNILRILGVFIIQVFFIIIGPIVVGLALLFNRIEPFDPISKASRPNHRFKDKWINAIWGNDDDGIDGDIYYLLVHVNGKRNFWTRFNWTVLRNPVHNLGLKLGFNGIAVRHIGFRKGFKKSECVTKIYNNDYNNCLDSKPNRTGFEYTEVYKKNGKMYPMYRLRWKYPFIKYGIKCNIGWKNFNVSELPKHYKYTFTILVNPFKTFKSEN